MLRRLAAESRNGPFASRISAASAPRMVDRGFSANRVERFHFSRACSRALALPGGLAGKSMRLNRVREVIAIRGADGDAPSRGIVFLNRLWIYWYVRSYVRSVNKITRGVSFSVSGSRIRVPVYSKIINWRL